MRNIFVVGGALLCAGCLGIPAGVTPVSNFQIDKYQGVWYEIARLDHPFERGLSNVTAEYQLQPDGSVAVVNRGFRKQRGTWTEAQGRAEFVNETDEGYLKVSFFGPFYGSYVIFELDQQYRYAFVSGADTSYLWLLARTPTVSDAVRTRFIQRAAALGFATDALIVVEQDRAP